MMQPDTDHTRGPLLVVDGILPSDRLLQRLIARHDRIIAADGAALRLRERGILPSIIVGDLDTVGESLGWFHEQGVESLFVMDQEAGDLEKSLDWILSRGRTAVTIVGMEGGMADHALNNYSVVARWADRLRIELVDDNAHCHLLPESSRITITSRPGERVSLIPLPYARVTTHGLEWELEGTKLEFGVREGASNRAVAEEIRIEVSEGVIALFHYPTDAPFA